MSSCAVPRCVSLKAFAARVFTFLCAIAVNVVNVETFCSKARAHANSTEAGFKSTAFLTPGTERNCVSSWDFVLADFYRISQIPAVFPTMLALEFGNDFASFCLFLDRRPMAPLKIGTAK